MQRLAKFATPRAIHTTRLLHESTKEPASVAVDPRVGTVAAHRHHLVVCNSHPEQWPSKVEGLSETISALSRGATLLPNRAMVTLSDFAPLGKPLTTDFTRIDVAVFPLGLLAKNLDLDGVQRLLALLAKPLPMPTSWSPSAEQQLPFDHAWLELSRNRHIFVCTHGSRDQLCGVHGTNLLAELRSLIAGRKLSRNLAAWATSHVGGHKFAANAIVYPRGDWYATWCEKCNAAAHPATSSPAAAEAIVSAALRDVVWWEAWRGATNMSKQDQIDTWSQHALPVAADHEATSDHTTPGSIEAWLPPLERRRKASTN